MQVVTEILIDFSHSMTNKLEFTRNVLMNDVVPNLDYSARIGIKTFSATGSKDPIIKSILPLSITNKEQITEAIYSLSGPAGNTPIAAAIRNSVDSLKEYLAFNKKIILITDGEENCGGDYGAEAERAKSNNIDCQIHVIGLGLTAKAASEAEAISRFTGGSFSPIRFEPHMVYDQKVVKPSLSSFYAGITTKNFQGVAVQQNPNSSNPANYGSAVSTPPVPANEPVLNGKPTTDLSSATTDKTLKLIVDEIRDIKAELNHIKETGEKASYPEENEELNERIRKDSEEYLFTVLNRKYPNRVKWLNEGGESYSDHDFEILDLDGSVEYYIECKGTSKSKPTFFLTKAEWRLFLNHTKNYQIYFIRDVFERPTPIFIDNLLDWLLKGKVVPYLIVAQAVKDERVTLTLVDV